MNENQIQEIIRNHGDALPGAPLESRPRRKHPARCGLVAATAIGVVHRVFRGRHQAQGQAIYGSLAYGLGGGIGGFVSGYVWGQWGAGLTFSMASACALLAALVLWRGLRLE